MKKILVLVLFIVSLFTLTACSSNLNIDRKNADIQFTVPGANPELDTPADNGRVAGLGTGFFHGLLAPLTLFISFFNPAVQMYEVHNDGAWYNLGFLIGSVLLFAFGGFSGGRRRA